MCRARRGHDHPARLVDALDARDARAQGAGQDGKTLFLVRMDVLGAGRPAGAPIQSTRSSSPFVSRAVLRNIVRNPVTRLTSSSPARAISFPFLFRLSQGLPLFYEREAP
jgi:hypothetical protein